MLEVFKVVVSSLFARGGGRVRSLMALCQCLLSLPGYIRRIVVSMRRIAIALEGILDYLRKVD